MIFEDLMGQGCSTVHAEADPSRVFGRLLNKLSSGFPSTILVDLLSFYAVLPEKAINSAVLHESLVLPKIRGAHAFAAPIFERMRRPGEMGKALNDELKNESQDHKTKLFARPTVKGRQDTRRGGVDVLGGCLRASLIHQLAPPLLVYLFSCLK